tara:strand:+ start:764 stop:1012 length:249 start_codon:yes stop_codon:yes gene_type:complete
VTPITDREVGSIEQKLENIEHRQRNDRTVINGLSEEIDDLQTEINLVRLELNQLKYKAYGISSAVVVLLGVLALIIDLIKGK